MSEKILLIIAGLNLVFLIAGAWLGRKTVTHDPLIERTFNPGNPDIEIKDPFEDAMQIIEDEKKRVKTIQ